MDWAAAFPPHLTAPLKFYYDVSKCSPQDHVGPALRLALCPSALGILFSLWHFVPCLVVLRMSILHW